MADEGCTEVLHSGVRIACDGVKAYEMVVRKGENVMGAIAYSTKPPGSYIRGLGFDGNAVHDYFGQISGPADDAFIDTILAHLRRRDKVKCVMNSSHNAHH